MSSANNNQAAGVQPLVAKWLQDFSVDFQRRFVSLLPSSSFRTLPALLALSVIDSCLGRDSVPKLTKSELDVHLTPYDLKRLELYSNNLVDYHLITDILPTISRLFFCRKFDSDINLSPVQSAVLLNLGLQLKTVNDIETELGLPASQILGLFNRSIRKISNYLRKVSEKSIEGSIKLPRESKTNLLPMPESLNDELNREAAKIEKKQKVELKKLSKELAKDLDKYQIKGNQDDWDLVTLSGQTKSVVSIKTIEPKGGNKESNQGSPGKKRKKEGNNKKFKKFGKKHKAKA